MSLSIHDAARAHPTRVALVTESAELSYAALEERVARARGWLDASGITRSGEPLAVVARRRADDVALLYAAIDRGVPFLPLHVRSTAAERAHLVETVRAAVVVDDVTALSLARAAPAPPTHAVIDPERPLALVATSGTTAAPRVVVLSRRAFLASAEASARCLGWRDGDRWLVSMPLAHVGGLSILVRTLVGRRTACLLDEGPWDPAHVIARIRRDRVTLASFVPTMLTRLLAVAAGGHAAPAGDARAPSELRAVLVGGAAASAPLLDAASLAGLPVLATYGLTEACSQVATQRPGQRRLGSSDVGSALHGVGLRIADGFVEVRGSTSFSGYAGGASVDPDTWWRTGDLGRLDDGGRLELLGRADDRISVGGEKVAPLEVEAALLLLPDVLAACVVGVPDDALGEVVAAALVLRRPASDAGLLEAARDRLAPYKAPRLLRVLSSLPYTHAGKVDRAAVRRLMTHPHGVPAHQPDLDVYPSSPGGKQARLETTRRNPRHR